MTIYEIHFHVKTEFEPDAQELCNAMFDAFNRAKGSINTEMSHISECEIVGHDVSECVHALYRS